MTEPAIRTATAADKPAVSRLLATAFHNASEAAEKEEWGEVFEPDRSLVIEDDGAVVAHAGAFTRELTVPGGPLPAAHVTMVGVQPTHRRRGMLNRLMHRQLAEVPEPVAVLWASEGRIYPRYGYGMATQRVSFSVDTREVRLPEPTAMPGELRTFTAVLLGGGAWEQAGEIGGQAAAQAPSKAAAEAEAGADVRRVYDVVRADRPGWSSRDERWWNTRTLADPPGQRGGATELRATLHSDAAGTVSGYALWRAKSDWSPGGPEGDVQVKEVVATTPDAHLALWRFLLGIDLTRSASMWLGGLDEPLLYLANEPRRLGTALGDGLFVRIVDLPRALTNRRYAAPVEVVLDVTDPILAANTGRWRLTADPGQATCTRTADPADLACEIGALGAAYLGGIPLGALAAAGRVRELRPGTVPAASAAFGWHRPPAAGEIF